MQRKTKKISIEMIPAPLSPPAAAFSQKSKNSSFICDETQEKNHHPFSNYRHIQYFNMIYNILQTMWESITKKKNAKSFYSLAAIPSSRMSKFLGMLILPFLITNNKLIIAACVEVICRTHFDVDWEEAGKD